MAHRAKAPSRGSFTRARRPPTASPDLHHVWARVYKDLFCRYQTMQGRYVARRAGWDTHGLPVEVQVEKQLGISGKKEIEEKVGIAEFTRLCRESVLTYVGEFERLTERIGYWTDMEHAYYTFHPSYIESVWWQLKQLFENGLLYEDYKVIPYCPRCETGLSSHELGQPGVYADETDESAYVRLRLTDAHERSDLGGATHLAVWTTTPWTLLSNVAVAVNPDVTYGVVNGVVVAKELATAVFGEDAVVAATFPGSALLGLHYERPFADVATARGCRRQLRRRGGVRHHRGRHGTRASGAGLRRDRPPVIAREHGLPTLNPVGPDGTFNADGAWLEGQHVRDANHAINDELERRGLLIRRFDYTHSLPHCWRCGTVLIYWANPSGTWRPARFKDQLLERERHHRLAPRSHPRRAHGRVAGQQRRLGALARPLLGDTPADLALRGRSPHMRRVARRAAALAGRDLERRRAAPARDRRSRLFPVHAARTRPGESSR